LLLCCLGAVVVAGVTAERRVAALLAAVHEHKEISNAPTAKIRIHLFFMFRNLLEFAPLIGWLENRLIMMGIFTTNQTNYP
jgi:hypothetical protein